MTSRAKKPPASLHRLRIIGGRWRSRTFSFPVVDGLRPTGDRIRETLFNWLAPILPGARCLDLFAGSGILGLEALSRGASHCTLVELHPAAAKQLRQNAQLLGANNAQVLQTSALAFLDQQPEPVDVVFLDPPFSGDFWQPVMNKLNEGWLRDGAMIYVESRRDAALIAPANWLLHREKLAGQVCYRLYRYETNVSGRV